MILRIALLGLVSIVASAALAAPPPPPPQFVAEAARLLTAPATPDSAVLIPLFAPDVAISVNGAPAGAGASAWLKWYVADTGDYDRGRVIGSSQGWGAGGEDAGDLLVIDTFDPVGSAHLPPNIIADVRMQTRSILYRFGADHRIHAVQVAEVKAFFKP